MKQWWKKKKFWSILLGIIILGLIIYFVFFAPRTEILKEELKEEEISEEFKWDKSAPTSLIESPEVGAWQRANFSIETFEEDLESGVNPDQCKYETCAYNPEGDEFCTDWISRECNYTQMITVGQGRMCRFEGRKACFVYVGAKDKAGNFGESNKYYHIDWTKPRVEKVYIEETLEKQTYPIEVKKGIEYLFKVKVTDNFKIAQCSFYVDDKFQKEMSFSPSDWSNTCTASATFTFPEPKSYFVYALCSDAARNGAKGETVEIKINLPPKIFTCRVNPTQGTTQTNFQFGVEATDPDGDELFYFWDFGDGENSLENNPTHRYSKTGTSEPKVIVFDGRGGEVECSTAWVTVNEK